MAKEKILVVDDELSIRMALRTAFVREGMVVMEASGGQEALRIISEQNFDLIILDIMMQDMDGYMILQKLRADRILTPVLMLSGRQEEMDQVIGLGLGADDYLTKPFQFACLYQIRDAASARRP